MGAWSFVHSKLVDELGPQRKLTVAARAESASPATGSVAIHQQEHDQLLAAAFA
jgi:2-oxoglutarate dehydrogenase E1 component